MRRSALIVGLVVQACSVDGADTLLNGAVELEVAVRTDHPEQIRVAVVWVIREANAPRRYVVPTDVALTDTSTAFTKTFTIEMVGLDDATTAAASPRETVDYGTVLAPAYRPRVVVYEDLDDNLRLDLAAIDGDGADRIIGADPSFQASVAYQLTVERLLRALDERGTTRFYRATGERYTPFVHVIPAGDTLDAGEPTRVAILASGSPVEAASIRCERRVAGTAARPTAYHVQVDTALEPTSVCGVDAATCRAVELAAVEPPLVVDDELEPVRGVVCRRNELFDVLALHENRLVCEGCLCGNAPRAAVYVAVAGQTPAWWPCGDTIAYCPSDRPLFERDDRCVTE